MTVWKPVTSAICFFVNLTISILRDSEVSFLTPSGQRAELAIPQLTWLNDPRRHLGAEGLVSLSSLTGQHGVMQVRMDLRDDEGLLSNGRVWLQAD